MKTVCSGTKFSIRQTFASNFGCLYSEHSLGDQQLGVKMLEFGLKAVCGAVAGASRVMRLLVARMGCRK